jgi:hypothetical protein
MDVMVASLAAFLFILSHVFVSHERRMWSKAACYQDIHPKASPLSHVPGLCAKAVSLFLRAHFLGTLRSVSNIREADSQLQNV